MVESLLEWVALTFFILVFHNTFFEPVSKNCGKQPISIWIIGVFLCQYTVPILLFGFGTGAFHNRHFQFLGKVIIGVFGITFFVWNVLGSVWIMEDMFGSDKCLTPFQFVSLLYVNVCLYAIYVAAINWLYQHFLSIYKTKELGERLEQIYKDPKKAKRQSAKRILRKFKTVIETTPLLDIEQKIMDLYCTEVAETECPDRTCGICINEFALGDKITRVQCDHLFHPECIENWYRVKPTCPFCKKPFREELLRIYLEKCSEPNGEQKA